MVQFPLFYITVIRKSIKTCFRHRHGLFTSFFGNTKLATMMSSEQARFMTFKRVVVERAPYLLERQQNREHVLGFGQCVFSNDSHRVSKQRL